MGLLDMVIRAATKAVNSHAKQFEDLQREQFDSGKDATGKVRKAYSASTKRYKRKKGQPTNRVTLKDSGDSYKAVKVSADSRGIEIDVNTEYFQYMVDKYGEGTIGVEPETLRKYFEQYVFPNIQNELIRSDISQ